MTPRHPRRWIGIGSLVMPIAFGTSAGAHANPASAPPSPAPGSEASAAAPTGDPITIGYAAARIRILSRYDSPAGAQREAENINNAGGILGRPVEVLVRDMKNDPASAATVGQELLDAGAVVIRVPRRRHQHPDRPTGAARRLSLC